MIRIFLFDTKAQELTIKYASVRCETGGCFLWNVFRPELKGKRYVKTEGGFCLVNVEKEEGNVWDDSL